MDDSDQRNEPGHIDRAASEPGPDVVVNAMLCDAAFVMNGEVLVRGGVRDIFTGSGSPLRIPSVGIGAHIEPSAHHASGQHVLQIRLHCLELPSPGRYEFILSLDGMLVRRMPFRVDQMSN